MKPKDPMHVEEPLQRQHPADLDSTLIDRLESAADGSLLELPALEREFETRLRNIRPNALHASLLQRLESKTTKLPFPPESHLIAFPANKSASRPQGRAGWAVAAAVALLGAMAALLVDLGPAPTTAKDQSNSAPVQAPASLPPEIQPAQFSRDLSTAVDAGIVWKDNQQPHRVLKVVYTDRVSLKRQDGTSYEVEEPRVEYILVPAESH